MDEKQFKSIKEDLDAIKKLLALGLKQSNVDVKTIGKAMNISGGRVSQMVPQKKYKKKIKK
jgi:DNA-directed RNA polymerase specialized sigma subunit